MATSAKKLFAEARRLYNRPEGWSGTHAGFKLLKQAAALGHGGAHEWLGFVYYWGLGTRRNMQASFRHYLAAAEAGRPGAMYHAGVNYGEGCGVKRSYKLAFEWFTKAERCGDADARHAFWYARAEKLGAY